MIRLQDIRQSQTADPNMENCSQSYLLSFILYMAKIGVALK